MQCLGRELPISATFSPFYSFFLFAPESCLFRLPLLLVYSHNFYYDNFEFLDLNMSLPVSHYFLERWHTTPLPRLIDELAELCPNHPMVSLPRDNGRPELAFHDYSIKDFANAVNRAAWWIEEKLGRAQARGTTLHYVAPQDLSYFIITLAAVKTGYQVRMTSVSACLLTTDGAFVDPDLPPERRRGHTSFPHGTHRL